MNNPAITISQETKFKTGAKKARVIKTIAVFVILVGFALMVLVPFYLIFITSFKDRVEADSPLFSWWPQQGFYWRAYDLILFRDPTGGQAGFSIVLRGFINTLIVVIPPTLLGLFTSALSGYAFAKMRFPFKKTLFTILLFTMMIPGIIMMFPAYFIWAELGFIDTYIPLMVPGMFGAAAAVFFLRQFFYSIPTELVESAKIDGKSHWGIFWSIMVPLSGGALIAQGVLGFVGGYNDFMGPLLYLRTVEAFTLQLALHTFVGTHGGIDLPAVAAGTVIALVPVLILYLLAQRFFIEGIATTGLKV